MIDGDSLPARSAALPGRGCLLAVACASALFCASDQSVAALPAYGAPRADEMRAHFIDVGQGSAVLLEFACGAALIDTGGEKNKSFDGVAALQDYLDRFFARRADRSKTLDLVVVTHAHIDHTRGLPMVLNRYTVRSLVDNGLETGSGGRQQKSAHARAKAPGSKMAWQPVRERSVVSTEGLTSDVIDPIDCEGADPRLTALWGALDQRDDWSAGTLKNGNDSSVVMRLQFGKASFLFPGDLEEDVQSALIDFFTPGCDRTKPETCPLDVDVYHVSHHGSHNGTTTGLMTAMTPRIAVITMGRWNRREQWSAYAYGHPRADTIRMLIDSDTGVHDPRTPEIVMVANRAASKTARGAQFSRTEMARAVYGTGWEGTVVVTARADGQLHVDVENE